MSLLKFFGVNICFSEQNLQQRKIHFIEGYHVLAPINSRHKFDTKLELVNINLLRWSFNVVMFKCFIVEEFGRNSTLDHRFWSMLRKPQNSLLIKHTRIWNILSFLFWKFTCKFNKGEKVLERVNNTTNTLWKEFGLFFLLLISLLKFL